MTHAHSQFPVFVDPGRLYDENDLAGLGLPVELLERARRSGRLRSVLSGSRRWFRGDWLLRALPHHLAAVADRVEVAVEVQSPDAPSALDQFRSVLLLFASAAVGASRKRADESGPKSAPPEQAPQEPAPQREPKPAAWRERYPRASSPWPRRLSDVEALDVDPDAPWRILTLSRPWAHGVFHHGADALGMRRATDYRGLVWIHAGRSAEDVAFFPDGAPVTPAAFTRSRAVIGLARLTDCVRDGRRWVYRLADRALLDAHILWPGELPGLYDVPSGWLTRELRETIARHQRWRQRAAS